MTQIVDKARRDRLASIENRLKTLDLDTARNAVMYGALFAEVERDELWRDEAYDGFYAWVEDRMGYRRETARKMMRVTEHFTGDMAERFGVEKLFAALRYLDATARAEKPGDVLAIDFRVQDDRGRFVSVPFAKATVRQIDQARAIVLAARSSKEEDKDLADRVVALAAALPAAPVGTGRGVRVKVETGKDGRRAVSLRGLPLDDLDAALDAVRAAFAEG